MIDITLSKKETILVIDDDPVILDLVDAIFEEQITILRAANGHDGIELANKEKPDLILLDVRMPSMDGYEVCRELKNNQETEDIPIVFLTARTETEAEYTGLELGAIDYIAKPIIPQIFEVRIKNHLTQKRLRDQLAIMSSVDGLTGISNRRHFDEYLDQEWRRGTRSHYPLSLLMIDVDHFKLYNDTYGHQQGDETLKLVAREIGNHLRRPSDLAARYGGEEFSVILPDTPFKPALALAERLRSGIDRLNLEHTTSETVDHVTVSIGLTTLVPTEEMTSSDFIQAADKNLYASKHGGRNRVTGKEE